MIYNFKKYWLMKNVQPLVHLLFKDSIKKKNTKKIVSLVCISFICKKYIVPVH